MCILMKNFESGKLNTGALFLVLQTNVCWEDFRDLSSKWAAKLEATILSEPLITFDECLLEVKIGEGTFWITYDDFQAGIHLEPRSTGYDNVVLSLQEKLRAGT